MPNLPHPFDLEIQDFSSYSLVIDARSPREFAEDHLPGATNLPVVDNDEYAEVGTLHRTDKHFAYMVGVSYSLENIARNLRGVISHYSPSDRILVYCFRGGKRSKLWADNLRTVGYTVDVLRGGWKAYRRWIICALESLPRALSYRVLTGPTGVGKTRLLAALAESGAQVLDLEGLARHRGSLIGWIPDQPQPSQKGFDSALVDTLRQFSPDRPVWVEAESKKIGQVQLPIALFESMHASPTYRIHASLTERIRLWHEDYPHFQQDPQALMRKLQPLKALHGNDELTLWQTMADQNDMSGLYGRLMTHHYDPAYERSTSKHYSGLAESVDLRLDRLDAVSLLDAARSLVSR